MKTEELKKIRELVNQWLYSEIKYKFYWPVIAHSIREELHRGAHFLRDLTQSF